MEILSYGKERIGGGLGWKDERTAKGERIGPYLIRNGITLTMQKMVRAACGLV